MRLKQKTHQGLPPAQSFLPKGRTTWATSERGEGRAWAGSVLSVALCGSCFFSWRVQPQQGVPGTVTCSGFPQGFFHGMKAPRQSNAPTAVTPGVVLLVWPSVTLFAGWQESRESWEVWFLTEFVCLCHWHFHVQVEGLGRDLCGLQVQLCELNINWIII